MVMDQTEIQSEVIELAYEAFEMFCKDINCMFEVDIECTQLELEVAQVKRLKKRFGKLTACNKVKSDGILDGNFQLIFDQAALFTLSGVIVMLPESRILANAKNGTIDDAQHMDDAIKEVGNLLVGSWDRVFREELDGHDHFVQTRTFIGNPWENPAESIDFNENEEYLFAGYELKLSTYPAFNCGVIFPKSLFDPQLQPETTDEADTVSNQSDSAEQTVEQEKTELENETASDETQETALEQETVITSETAAENHTSEVNNTSEESIKQDPDQNKTIEAQVNEADTEETEPAQNSATQTDSTQTIKSENIVETEFDSYGASNEGLVSEAINSMIESVILDQDESINISLSICASDMMNTNTVWASCEESVELIQKKMLQHDVGFILVGIDGKLEGMISQLEIASALSPYLRPMFSKWCRALDRATLYIKAQWVMTRPVITVRPTTSAVKVIEMFRRNVQSALPVVGADGKVEGLITIFDVLKMFSKEMGLLSEGKSREISTIG